MFSDPKRLENFAKIFIIVGFLVLVFFLFLFIRDNYIDIKGQINPAIASNIGNFLGSIIGLIWTLVGVLLLYATLNLQRKEFVATRNVIYHQQFENTYFNMLSQLLAIATNAKKEFDTGMAFEYKSGVEYFEYVLEELKDRFKKRFVEAVSVMNEGNVPKDFSFNHKKDIAELYETVFEGHQSNLGHYFRYLYNIIQFVKKSKIEEDEKEYYIHLIQAQMSNVQLGLLFYNGISKYAKNAAGKDNFFNLIEKYQLLENIDKDCILDYNHLSYYPDTVFKFKRSLTKEDIDDMSDWQIP